MTNFFLLDLFGQFFFRPVIWRPDQARNNDFLIKQGDRIAQFIIEKITETEVYEVEDLDDTDRGVGGFGSTGVSEKLKEENVKMEESEKN